MGTPQFMAPEVVECLGYGKSVDAWSAGVLLHVLLSGTLPFLGTGDMLYDAVCQANLSVSKGERTMRHFFRIRIFFVEYKAIQNCINLKTTNLYISINTFQAISTFIYITEHIYMYID